MSPHGGCMPTAKKIGIVEELKELIARSTIAIGAEYRGLRVGELNALRRQLRDAGIEMHVVKNRLLRIAAEKAGRPQIGELAEGPTAMVFGYGDVVVPAKVVADYVRTARNAFAPRKAYLDGQIVPGAELDQIASLPPKPVPIALVAGALQAPVARLAGLLSAAVANPAGRLLNATFWDTAGLLEARAKQLEKAA